VSEGKKGDELNSSVIPAPQQEVVKELIKKVTATPLPVKNVSKKARRKMPIWLL